MGKYLISTSDGCGVPIWALGVPRSAIAVAASDTRPSFRMAETALNVYISSGLASKTLKIIVALISGGLRRRIEPSLVQVIENKSGVSRARPCRSTSHLVGSGSSLKWWAMPTLFLRNLRDVAQKLLPSYTWLLWIIVGLFV
jgi:hypothetical protein